MKNGEILQFQWIQIFVQGQSDFGKFDKKQLPPVTTYDTKKSNFVLKLGLF